MYLHPQDNNKYDYEDRNPYYNDLNRGNNNMCADIADYIIDNMCFDEWHSGYIKKTQIKCKYCKSTDVYWHQHKNGSWCLYDNETKEYHKCKEPSNNAIKLKEQIDKKQEELKALAGQLRKICDHPKKYHIKEEINDPESWFTHIVRCSFCGEEI